MSETIKEATIHRCPHDGENPYAQISRDLIRDSSISPECRWMIIYLLSMKDGWNINIQQIVNHVKGMMGRNKVYDLINEAIEAGYMMKQISKVGNLKQNVKYFISEKPKFKKCFRHPEIQEVEKGDTENEDYKKEHTSKKENKEKKQQQKPTASAAAFYKCIEEIGLSKKEQRSLMKYPEEEVKIAVQFATHPSVIIKTTLIKTIMWAIKAKPELPEEVDKEENKKYAKLAEMILISDTWNIDVLDKKVNFYSKNPGCIVVHSVSYDEEDFRKKLDKILKELKFTKPIDQC